MTSDLYSIQDNAEQPWQNLRWVGKLWFTLICITILLPLLSLPRGSVASAAMRQAGDIPSYADTVIVMDNINEIKSHDPTGVRFSAAQLFVDMAPRGDSIGVVRIPSSSLPSPVQLLDLHTIQTSNDRDIVKSKLSQSQDVFKSVDPGPTAYFVRAIQMAGDMLSKVQHGNRKYVVIVTDTVALSGDPGGCSDSPDQFHNWFCSVKELEAQGISVVLFGFTTPGPQAQKDLLPTKNYINAHGGIVLEVDDGAGVPQVAEQYANLMSRIHPNIFQAVLGGKIDTINVDSQDRLTGLTFVALGSASTSLAQVQDSTADNVAGKNSQDGTLYNSNGAGYWLQTINSGNLAGTWHLGAGNPSPSEILVLGVSGARFQLLNPAPAHGDSDISQRYVATNERVALRARVTGVDGNPITGVPFVANPNSDNQQFTTSAIPTSAIPGNNTADMIAILGVATTQGNTLYIGLGRPLAGGTYLEKQFQIMAKVELTNKGVRLGVPPSRLLKAGASIPITAQGTSSTDVQSLSIFGRDASTQGWTQISTSSSAGDTNVSGTFALQRGCGNTYTFVAVEEISGLLNDGLYDYLAYDESPYISQLEQGITGTATLTSDTTLSLWAFGISSSQVTWNVNFTSTVCSARDMELGVALRPDQFPNDIQMSNGGGSFTIAENRQTTKPVTVTIGNCPLNSLWGDQTDTLQLKRLINVGQGTEFIQAGDWEPKITCPSFSTYARGHIWQSLLIIFIASVIIARLFQLPLLPLLPGTHLKGEVAIFTKAAALVGEDLPNIHSNTPVTIHIPRTQYSAIWYLVKRMEGENALYTFEQRESPQALLQFKVQDDQTGYHVMVAATKHATDGDLPQFHLTRTRVGQEPVVCDGEPIVLDHDLLYPVIDVVP